MDKVQTFAVSAEFRWLGQISSGNVLLGVYRPGGHFESTPRRRYNGRHIWEWYTRRKQHRSRSREDWGGEKLKLKLGGAMSNEKVVKC